MKIVAIAPNMTEIQTGNGCILFSYNTPVAVSDPCNSILKTNKKWSNTTSKHISKWIAMKGTKKVAEIEQEVIDRLVERE